MDKLRPILQAIRETFPNSPHTNMYAHFGDEVAVYGEAVCVFSEMNPIRLYFYGTFTLLQEYYIRYHFRYKA